MELESNVGHSMHHAKESVNDVTSVGVVASLCTVFTILVFLAGIEICIKIIKHKSTAGTSPFAFIAGCINCTLWLKYGMAVEDVSVIFVNGFGLLLQCAYLLIFTIYTNDKFVLALKALAASLLLTVLELISFLLDPEVNKKYSGCIACLAVIVFISSPLSALADVVRTKKTDNLPFVMIFLSFVMSFLWTVYGYLIKDNFILIPNGLGTWITSLQLLLFYFYPSKKGHSYSRLSTTGY